MFVLAFFAIVIAINWMAFAARKRRREKLEATRNMWATEEPVREFYAKKSILAVVACFAGFLCIVACGLVGLLVVHWTLHRVLAMAAFVPFTLAAIIGATVAGRNLCRIMRFGSGIPWAIAALRLDSECLRYFDLFDVPWDDVFDTGDLEVSMGRGGPRTYVLLFVRGSAADYARDGKLNRLEVKWAASMLRPAVQGQWPPFPKGDFIVVDVDFLDGAYAPRLKVWIDRLRQSAGNRGSENGDVHRDPQPVECISTDELSMTHLRGIDASHRGRQLQ